MKMASTRLAVLIGLLVLPCTAFAQSGGPYVLEWSTIDGGGMTSSTGLIWKSLPMNGWITARTIGR